MAIPTIHLTNDANGQAVINRVYEDCWKQGREPTRDDINDKWCKVYGDDHPYKQMPKYDKSREKGAGDWLYGTQQ